MRKKILQSKTQHSGVDTTKRRTHQPKEKVYSQEDLAHDVTETLKKERLLYTLM